MENTRRWNELTELKGYSKVKRAKAGATVLAEHPDDRNEYGNRILLATHNYSAGRAMIFTPNNSWVWQMGEDSNDDSHARFLETDC